LDDALLVADAPDADLVALDDALNALADVDPRKSRAIELRFFGGLSIDEAALVLEVSAETVKRDCRLAKAWLLRRSGEKLTVILT
jgi:RNA polymerase sigma factor (sigma-70 family)